MKIRIAVAVNDRGSWNAIGWNSNKEGHESMLRSLALDGLDGDETTNEVVHFVEADVPIPSPLDVKGKICDSP